MNLGKYPNAMHLFVKVIKRLFFTQGILVLIVYETRTEDDKLLTRYTCDGEEVPGTREMLDRQCRLITKSYREAVEQKWELIGHDPEGGNDR